MPAPKQKPPVNTMAEGMYEGFVREKSIVKLYEKWLEKGGKKFPIRNEMFLASISDDHQTWRCLFDACHFDSFSVGDSIGFTVNSQDEGFMKITKRCNVYNKTRSTGVKTVNIRPIEEIKHLLGNCHKRYDEIKSSLAKSPAMDIKIQLNAEMRNIRQLTGLLTYIRDGVFVTKTDGSPHEEGDPRYSFKSCTIVARYFGEEPVDKILERAKQRMEHVESKVQGYKESEEWKELTKLLVALKWICCEAKDTNIGMTFSWDLFTKKLHNDFVIHSITRDEYLEKGRAQNDEYHVRQDIERDMKTMKTGEQERRLSDKFPFLKEGGFIEARKGVKKGKNTKGNKS